MGGGQSQRELLADRHIDGAADVGAPETTQSAFDITAELVFRLARLIPDCPANGIAPEQSSLRTAQDFHLLYIQGFEQIPGQRRIVEIIQIDSDCRLAAVAGALLPQTAKVEGRSGAAR